ncbi:MAG: hypothetical protein WBP79_07305 [Candidatus Acidiferrales bacterium]
MKRHMLTMFSAAGFLFAFVLAFASPAKPGTPGPTAAPPQERHEAFEDLRRAEGHLKEARALLAGAPGEFGGHRDKAIRRVDQALAEVHEAIQSREHHR